MHLCKLLIILILTSLTASHAVVTRNQLCYETKADSQTCNEAKCNKQTDLKLTSLANKVLRVVFHGEKLHERYMMKHFEASFPIDQDRFKRQRRPDTSTFGKAEYRSFNRMTKSGHFYYFNDAGERHYSCLFCNKVNRTDANLKEMKSHFERHKMIYGRVKYYSHFSYNSDIDDTVRYGCFNCNSVSLKEINFEEIIEHHSQHEKYREARANETEQLNDVNCIECQLAFDSSDDHEKHNDVCDKIR